MQLHQDRHLAEQLENEQLLEQSSTSSNKRKHSIDQSQGYTVDAHRKRICTSETQPARLRINEDDDLWTMLEPLKEESRTAGVIPRLQPQFSRANSKKSNTVAAYLCSPYTDHISTGYTDLGWGCGYRNCQMLMTFLERQEEQAQPLLKQVPDIPGLQLLLEKAWREGFDPQGAEQLNHQVFDTRKWIGATEVYVMLVYLGIRCTVLDFDRPTGPNHTHDILFDWIQAYFEGAIPTKEEKADQRDKDEKQTDAFQLLMQSKQQPQNVHVTDRPPLYLQHSGHSRTVIGIEILEDGNRNLIMFDPGRRMLRSYHSDYPRGAPRPRPAYTEPEDDVEESALSSATGDEIDSCSSGTSTPTKLDSGDDDFTHLPSTLHDDSSSPSRKPLNSSNTNKVNRLLRYPPSPRHNLPPNLLRPYRVDAKAIAKNRQYQLLVLGEVVDQRTKGGTMMWNSNTAYLLTEWEREMMKKVTSITA
ncbi:peptidase family C78-domain-containing protein [Radiomyces spectabilis]|uniref:peptidase family C78-domain-containing protein n=1 Tax=Radiomyces spectabilis TaxID=64574 RepID=UPI00221E7D9D|nr:peptidase family C78-domain-containing protein [Radiomyces spectabilis]KAI8372737.1 peptidase family C78-domain-containing protein [Radiomyces spectabilis]